MPKTEKEFYEMFELYKNIKTQSPLNETETILLKKSLLTDKVYTLLFYRSLRMKFYPEKSTSDLDYLLFEMTGIHINSNKEKNENIYEKYLLIM